MKKILLCGACLTGNLGGEALYKSFIDEMNKNEKCEYTILSKYPKDEKEICEKLGYNMISFTTIKQLLSNCSFYIFAGLFKFLHLPYKWMATKSIKAYFENDVLADFSGISFCDDRPFSSIIINTLWFLPAFISKIPIIKISQSMGPFNKKYVSKLAKFVLPRINTLICRGDISYGYIKDFLPQKQVYNLPDVAFLLEPANKERVIEILKAHDVSDIEKYIVMGPSYVVAELIGEEKYAVLMYEIAKKLYEISELKLVLIPHSRSHSFGVGVDNVRDDINPCLKIKELLDKKSIPCTIISNKVDAKEFKGIISKAQVSVGSRYHYMIATISSGVPGIALGWSHKYYEMLKMVEQEHFSVNYNEINLEALLDLVDELYENRETIGGKINDKLVEVLKKSRENVRLTFNLMTTSNK